MSGGRRPIRDLIALLRGHRSRHRTRELHGLATRLLREAGGGHSRVVSLLNASLRLRRWLRYWLRLQPRRHWSRIRFRPPPAGGGRTLALVCPTRGRARQAARMLRSVAGTAADPSRVELMFYVDEDDPQLTAYRALFARLPRAASRLRRCGLIVGLPVGVPEAWNRLAAAATGDLLVMANDDQIYVDHGWDARLDARVEELAEVHQDGVLCLYFEAGQYPEGQCDFPIVSRRWYDTLGYFVPTTFSQWEVETWVFDIARRLERLFPVSEVFVDHLHYQDYKAPFDATYQRHRQSRETAYADHARFLRTAGQRAADADRLRAVIQDRVRG